MVQFPLHIYVLRHIVANKPESLVADEMSNIVHIARTEIVHTDNLMAFCDEAITQVTP